MECKQLDLDAPLLSIRRMNAQADCERTASLTPPRRRARPLLTSDLKSGLVGIPGTVPFVWETTPGQPKDSSADNAFLYPAAPKLPPGRSMKENGAEWSKGSPMEAESEMVLRTPTSITCSLDVLSEKVRVEEEELNLTESVAEDDAFSDARDAFSCAESFSMKCSFSAAGAAVMDHSKSLSKDPLFKDAMMCRFLPAAHAIAAGSLQRTWRKPPRAPVVHCENSGGPIVKSRLPLDYQYQLSRAQLHGTVKKVEDAWEEDDDDGSYAGSAFSPSNACGLIHRLLLKNSFGLLNPVPSTKTQGKRMPKPSTQTKVLHHASLNLDEDSWEAVYRYKQSHGYHPHKGEERKMSESNQLTSWSDSQMLDGSSFLNSSVGALSLEKHEDPKGEESGSSRRGSSGSCERDYEHFWETTYSHERLQGSGSMSPANKRPFNQESFHLQETPNCKSSENIPLDTKEMIQYSANNSVMEAEFQQIDESVVSETPKSHTLQPRSSEIAELGFSSCCGRLNGMGGDCRHLNSKDDGLLPPPLPTSPSESWLQRTLPSVSSKGPRSHQQSFLGIQLHSKKQVSWALGCDNKLITYEKPSKMHAHRMRIADVIKDA